MRYRICPYCKAHLDPEERCNCKDEEPQKEKSPITDQSMKDIVHMLKGMPQIGTTIQLYGKPVKVTGCLITENAAYVRYDGGNLVNAENLDRVANAKEY